MEFIQIVQHLTPFLDNIGAYGDLSQIWVGHFGFDWMSHGIGNSIGLDGTELHWAVLAQQFNTDVFATTRKVVGEFVASGKLWTLLIGVVIGYILKGLTSYG